MMQGGIAMARWERARAGTGTLAQNAFAIARTRSLSLLPFALGLEALKLERRHRPSTRITCGIPEHTQSVLGNATSNSSCMRSPLLHGATSAWTTISCLEIKSFLFMLGV